ncbi:MAG: sugar ABC transporter permease, partial [Firmicutes bacterium]|nr:sugar ABC transporter permease [Bacillota bacterium]
MKKKKLVKYGKYGYFFSIPFIVAFLFFSLYPIIYTFMIAFTDLKGLGTELNFLDEPFANFKAIFANKTFVKA